VSASELFRPFQLNGLTLPNRIVMAPMTRNYSPRGVPGIDVQTYYRRRAEGGVGLILTEGTAPCPGAQNAPRVPHIYGDEAIHGWEKVVSAVHDAGGRIGMQLWHVGAAQHGSGSTKLPASPVSPSGLFKPGRRVGKPMNQAQIDAVIEAFAQGAAEAQRIGFDAIELHGAHGYLIDQFFWDGTNHRTDQYGGDLVDRTRFAVQIIRECRRRVGPGFPLLLRFSQWKPQDYSARLATSPAELGRFLKPLASAGLDAFHCSTRRFWEPEFQGSDLNLAGWTKRLTGIPTITVGSVGLDTDFTEPFRGAMGDAAGKDVGEVRHLDRLVEMLARGDFDLVAIGRALLADPTWPVKVRDGRTGEIRPFSQRTLATLA